MSHSTRVSAADVRAIGRLIGDVRAVRGGADEQRRVLVDGACALLGADEGFFAHFVDWRRGQRPRAAAMVPGTVCDPQVTAFTGQFYAEHAIEADAMGAALFDATADAPTVAAIAWSDVRRTRTSPGYAPFHEVVHAARLGDILDPAATDGRGNLVALSLHRVGGKSRAFTAHEKGVARALAEELKWLHETRRLNVDAVLDARPAMSPRLRDVHALLLTDLSAKQIAARLGLSPHTVREYIHHVYQACGVSSRAELFVKHLRPD